MSGILDSEDVVSKFPTLEKSPPLKYPNLSSCIQALSTLRVSLSNQQGLMVFEERLMTFTCP